jgi:asparagine synthase (glutamine-hydrolysing)
VPAAARLRSGESKWVLKKAFEGKLPNDILYRKKMGFASPLDAWMRGDLRVQVETLAQSECLNDMGLISSKGVAALFEEHDGGRRMHGRALFAVLMLEKSVKRLMGGTEPTAAIAA